MEEKHTDLKDLLKLAVENMAVAFSIVSIKGTLIYYNKKAGEVLDRRPEYLGADIHSHHKKKESNIKFDRMIQEFEKGRTEPFIYEAEPYGKAIFVTLSPIFNNGTLIGCSQIVQLKEDLEVVDRLEYHESISRINKR